MTLIILLIASLFQQGNEYYANGDWANAAASYKQCLADTMSEDGCLTDKSRSEVYYNLGNACFKQGELAQSILWYERCLRLKPRHKDARFNLEFARSRITDNIEDNRTFFIASWLQSIRDLLTESTWQILSIILFILSLTCWLLFALGRLIWLRKTAFHIAWIALLATIISGADAYSLHKRDRLHNEAIITQGVLNAKSSPDNSGTDLFTLHEGTKVEIEEVLGGWCNIRVGNNEGWVNEEHLERI